MAKMFPSQPRYDTQSRAEIFLFHELERQLSDDFLVFHSVAWQIRDHRTGNHDGEADFVIIHPTSGILVLEVKGGQITYESGSDAWFSNGRSIKDPFQQGTKAKYSLLNKLKEIDDWNGRFVSIGNAIAVPDMIVGNFVRLNGPRELILDANDAGNISDWIDNAFQYLKGSISSKNAIIDSETIEKLKRIFYPSWDFNVSLINYFAQQNIVIQKLTQEQFLILDFLQRQRRVAISGCAGSGKTLLALEKAIRLANDGFSVLVLCNNPFLAQDLRDKVAGNNVQVYDFITLIDGLSRGNTFDFQEYLDAFQVVNYNHNQPDQWTQYNEPSPQKIDIAFSILAEIEERFDAVIVDEGQDFRETWWIIAEACLQSQESGIFYIFFDDRQAIFPFGSQSQYPIMQAPYSLSKNCRNAGKIFEIVRNFYFQVSDISPLLAEHGVVKQWQYRDGDVDEAIGQLKNALNEAMQYSPDLRDIAVITTEISPTQQSILNGSIIRNPLVDTRWQDSISSALLWAGASLRGLDLSEEKQPTEQDVQTITKHCLIEYINHYHKGFDYKEKPRLKWLLKSSGLERSPGQSPRNVIRYFGHRECVSDFMFYFKPFRLTAISDRDKFPEYNNILLSDIPSFKGLEANGVLLFYWGIYPIGYEKQLETNLCVGLSRAKHLLFFISPFDMSEKIKDITSPKF